MTEFAYYSRTWASKLIQLPYSFKHLRVLVVSRVYNLFGEPFAVREKASNWIAWFFRASFTRAFAIADNRSRSKKADLVQLYPLQTASLLCRRISVLWFCSDSLVMALCARFCCFILLVALLPTLGSCIRPFAVPKNLFVQGSSPFTLPEGARMIRREALEPDESPQEFVEDLHGRLRIRRESPIPQPELSNVSF